MATEDAFNWRVEAACRAAWPATCETVLDGWLLRASGGPTRRANSANPLSADAAVSDGLIAEVERRYARVGLASIFRVPSMIAAIDPLLAARGYALEAPTRTLLADLADGNPAAAGACRVTPLPDRYWLDARDRLTGSSAEAAASARAIIATIALPGAFASIAHEGAIASLGFAVRQDDLLILESIMTDATVRQRGFAKCCVSALLDWGCTQGCAAAALQVMADNDAALALYRGLGFTRDLYRYHYRVKR